MPWNYLSHIVSTVRRSKKRRPPSGPLYCRTLREKKVSVRLARTHSSFTNFITHKHLSFETCSCWPDPACSVRSLFCYVWRIMGWERVGGGELYSSVFLRAECIVTWNLPEGDPLKEPPTLQGLFIYSLFIHCLKKGVAQSLGLLQPQSHATS